MQACHIVKDSLPYEIHEHSRFEVSASFPADCRLHERMDQALRSISAESKLSDSGGLPPRRCVFDVGILNLSKSKTKKDDDREGIKKSITALT